MNFATALARATEHLAFYLVHYAECEDCGDVWGQRQARLGILRCLHVIRLAKAHGVTA